MIKHKVKNEREKNRLKESAVLIFSYKEIEE